MPLGVRSEGRAVFSFGGVQVVLPISPQISPSLPISRLAGCRWCSTATRSWCTRASWAGEGEGAGEGSALSASRSSSRLPVGLRERARERGAPCSARWPVRAPPPSSVHRVLELTVCAPDFFITTRYITTRVPHTKMQPPKGYSHVTKVRGVEGELTKGLCAGPSCSAPAGRQVLSSRNTRVDGSGSLTSGPM